MVNQAQILRPHFCNYLKDHGDVAEPMFVLGLYGKSADFGVSLEVSFIKCQKNDQSLAKQNRVLTVLIKMPTYYFAQIEGVSQHFEGTEKNRQLGS